MTVTEVSKTLRYRVTAKLESAGSISVRRATGNVLNTRHCISGSAIRGALAACILGNGGTSNDPMFRQLFVDCQLRCSDLRKEGAVPWPQSMLECKEHGDQRDHFRRDILLAAGAEEVPLPSFTCPTCNAKLESPRGYGRNCLRNPEISPRYHAEKIGEMRMAHVQIDIRYGKAMPGQFYSATVLARDQEFIGYVEVPVSARTYFDENISKDTVLWLGRGRTRGQGQARLLLDDEVSCEENEMEDLVSKLNEKAGEFPALRDSVVFSCTLLSPTFLFDRWLLPKTELAATDFAEVQGYRLLAAFGRQTSIPGWHAAGDLPKAEAIAWAEGSCLLFGRAVHLDERKTEIERLAAILQTAQAFGIGERVNEGFGEVAFCHPIHEELAWKNN